MANEYNPKYKEESKDLYRNLIKNKIRPFLIMGVNEDGFITLSENDLGANEECDDPELMALKHGVESATIIELKNYVHKRKNKKSKGFVKETV